MSARCFLGVGIFDMIVVREQDVSCLVLLAVCTSSHIELNKESHGGPLVVFGESL